jgi:dihydroorotase
LQTILIKNANVWKDGEFFKGFVLIKDELIEDVGKVEPSSGFDRVIDAKGLAVLPGLIDVHVHLRDWGLSHKGTFESETMAAVAGGFTTVLDMPNSVPIVNSSALVDKRIKDAKDKIYCDVGFYAMLDSFEIINDLLSSKAIGFKIYMNKAKWCLEDDKLGKCIKKVENSDKILAIHAEHPNFLKGNEAGDIFQQVKNHPNMAEFRAVEEILKRAKGSNAKIHICHLSTHESLELIKKAKKNGLNLSAELTPHHALISLKHAKSMVSKDEKFGKILKIEPPIREHKDTDSLISGLNSQIISILATDHAPHLTSEKLSEDPPSGFPLLEIAFPLYMKLHFENKVGLKQLVDSLTINPAKRFGLSSVGKVEKKMIANLIIVDLKKEWVIDPSKFVSKAKVSPFDGWNVKGKIIKTIVRGKLAYDEEVIERGGKVIGRQG